MEAIAIPAVTVIALGAWSKWRPERPCNPSSALGPPLISKSHRPCGRLDTQFSSARTPGVSGGDCRPARSAGRSVRTASHSVRDYTLDAKGEAFPLRRRLRSSLERVEPGPEAAALRRDEEVRPDDRRGKLGPPWDLRGTNGDPRARALRGHT
ncbi:hypothetical protein NDU88_005158 [Pleurodeles waltl]|uniref:Uncharacterized protein n=1 Tax=Pleurodeles waltl TaxID=8319 RepID=A0AAV7TA08_PLEWA|nr:hypothetical protein NDU88_005158 [Pleurodeles waltl]